MEPLESLQHASPSLPHERQSPCWQESHACEQDVPQHCCPSAPHCAHVGGTVPKSHALLGWAGQEGLSGQHGLPIALPHNTHLPAPREVSQAILGFAVVSQGCSVLQHASSSCPQPMHRFTAGSQL